MMLLNIIRIFNEELSGYKTDMSISILLYTIIPHTICGKSAYF